MIIPQKCTRRFIANHFHYYTEMISANLVPDDRDLQNIGLFLVSQTSVKTSATF